MNRKAYHFGYCMSLVQVSTTNRIMIIGMFNYAARANIATALEATRLSSIAHKTDERPIQKQQN